MVIGVIQACSSLGSIACAALVPLLLRTAPGWRSVYFVGAVPLLIVAFARRNLRETDRFRQSRQDPRPAAPALGRILRTQYRGRVLLLALIWTLTYCGTQSAITFFKEFAGAERGWTDEQVGAGLSVAALVSLPLVFVSGRLLDLIGRRRGAVLLYSVTALGVYGAYTLRGPVGMTAALVLGIFGASAVLPVLNAYTAELFPTHLRSDAFAWSNNLLGRSGYVLSPLIVGLIAASTGWGPAVAATAVFPLLALALIWTLLPETVGRELEETSAM
jgi:putative MFS transporter